MKARFVGIHLDFFGFVASGLCAVHCAALPILLAMGALGSLSWLGDHSVELVFIVISIILASLSLVQSYLRVHKNVLPLIVVGLGFVLILASRFTGDATHHLLTTSGGISIAIAHLFNWKLLK